MSLLNYFRPIREKIGLPDPSGPLSSTVPSSSIAACNAEVIAVLEKVASSGVKQPYCKLSPAQRYEIGKKAAEMGTTSAIRHYKRKYPDLRLTEPTVRRIKNAYLDERKKRPLDSSSDDLLCELPLKKRGRPLLIGDDLDQKVQAYIKDMRKRGCVVNTAIVIAVGTGILMNDASFISRFGSTNIPLTLTKDWAKYILKRMGFVKRRGNTKSKVTVDDFDKLKKLFSLEVRNAVSMDEIPPQLIINFDQTGIHYVPVSSWSMEKEGAKRVEIIGKDDKRQITAVFAATSAGDFLPVQLVYKGTTTRCLPSFQFPSDWHATYSANHWSNEQTMVQYFEKIIFPYLAKKKLELKLASDHPSLLIFDNFNGQCTEDILKLLDSKNINVVIIPANCTDRLQPLDISVNKAAKEFLRAQFQEWYALQIKHQLQSNTEEPLHLRLSVVKPLGAKWMVDLYCYIKSKPEIVCNGFKAAGIVA